MFEVTKAEAIHYGIVEAGLPELDKYVNKVVSDYGKEADLEVAERTAILRDVTFSLSELTLEEAYHACAALAWSYGEDDRGRAKSEFVRFMSTGPRSEFGMRVQDVNYCFIMLMSMAYKSGEWKRLVWAFIYTYTFLTVAGPWRKEVKRSFFSYISPKDEYYEG